ncbi:hypothetical protein TNCV_3591411 [Trichonephila clavipes]|nr:hypothetical protein TNCV_3591411 [Trichonephila clavipes]
MATTHTEGTEEQHEVRLEDSHLQAHHSCFVTSDLFCSNQRNTVGCEWLKYVNQNQHMNVKHDFVVSDDDLCRNACRFKVGHKAS